MGKVKAVFYTGAWTAAGIIAATVVVAGIRAAITAVRK